MNNQWIWFNRNRFMQIYLVILNSILWLLFYLNYIFYELFSDMWQKTAQGIQYQCQTCKFWKDKLYRVQNLKRPYMDAESG